MTTCTVSGDYDGALSTFNEMVSVLECAGKPPSGVYCDIMHRYAVYIFPVGCDFPQPSRCPGAHPASYAVGTGSCPGVKWLGHGVNHPPPSSTKVKESVELYLLAFIVFRRRNITFTFMRYTFFVLLHIMHIILM